MLKHSHRKSIYIVAADEPIISSVITFLNREKTDNGSTYWKVEAKVKFFPTFLTLSKISEERGVLHLTLQGHGVEKHSSADIAFSKDEEDFSVMLKLNVKFQTLIFCVLNLL